jgi:hypothetical protein
MTNRHDCRPGARRASLERELAIITLRGKRASHVLPGDSWTGVERVPLQRFLVTHVSLKLVLAFPNYSSFRNLF